MALNFKRSSIIFHPARGAVFIQLASAIPLILIALFIFVWVGTFIHARIVIRDSLQIGIKQGAVLGKDSVSFRNPNSESDLASKVRSFRADGGDGSQFLKLIGFRPDNPTFPIESTYGTILSNASMRNFKPGPLVKITGGIKSLPPEYLFSMALIYEGVRSSLGTGNLKYPCTISELNTTSGCLICLPIYRRMIGGGMGSGTIEARCLSRNTLNIQCSYHASFPVINTINTLLRRMLGGGGNAIAPVVDEVIEGYTTNANMLVGNSTELEEREGCDS